MTLGHQDHGKSTLTAAITKVLYQTGAAQFVPYEVLADPPEITVQGVKVKATQIEYETAKAHYLHLDCHSAADYDKLLNSDSVAMDAAILVVSAADGPMPQTREHLMLARKKGIKSIIVYLNKIDLVDDDELIQLVELELRELLTTYGFNGKQVPIIRGSALHGLVGTRQEIGGRTITELLSTMDKQFIEGINEGRR